MKNDFKELMREIILLSEADNWNDARREWLPAGITLLKEATTCICGHSIREVCHIINYDTGQMADVGNVCINQFKFNANTPPAFAALKRISEDITKSPGSSLLQMGRCGGLSFRGDDIKLVNATMRDRNLSSGARAARYRVNRTLIEGLVKHEQKD